MSQVSKMILMAAAVFVLVACITVEFALYYTGLSEYRKNEDRLSMELDFAPDWQKSSGKIVSGDEVRYLVSKDEAFYRVITKECPTSFCTFNGMLDSESEEFIDPSDKFVCNTLSDSDGTIIGLQFIEVGLRDLSAGESATLAGELDEKKNGLTGEALEDEAVELQTSIDELLTGSGESNALTEAADVTRKEYDELLVLSIQFDSLQDELNEKNAELEELKQIKNQRDAND